MKLLQEGCTEAWINPFFKRLLGFLWPWHQCYYKTSVASHSCTFRTTLSNPLTIERINCSYQHSITFSNPSFQFITHHSSFLSSTLRLNQIPHVSIQVSKHANGSVRLLIHLPHNFNSVGHQVSIISFNIIRVQK